MTLSEIINQIESCRYTCEAGSLENNIAWQELKNRITIINSATAKALQNTGKQELNQKQYKTIVKFLWDGETNDFTADV